MKTTKITIPSFLREEFEERIEKLNKRLECLDGVNVIEILSSEKKLINTYVELADRRLDIFFDTMTVNLPIRPKINGMSYVGTINFSNDVKTIFSVNDSINLTSDSIHAKRCDHCINRL